MLIKLSWEIIFFSVAGFLALMDFKLKIHLSHVKKSNKLFYGCLSSGPSCLNWDFISILLNDRGLCGPLPHSATHVFLFPQGLPFQDIIRAW